MNPANAALLVIVLCVGSVIGIAAIVRNASVRDYKRRHGLDEPLELPKPPKKRKPQKNRSRAKRKR